VSTGVVCFPFDLFGSAGTSQGATLLADAVREMLTDTRRETRPCRGRAYDGQVRVREVAFDEPTDYTRWLERGRQAVRQAWTRGEFLVWLSGNHLGVMPVYEELGGTPGGLVVQLDAHLDLYHLRDIAPRPTHGNFLRHLSGPPPAIINVGHRDLFLPADEWRPYYHSVYPSDHVAADPSGVDRGLRKAAKAAARVVLDLDCDALDPSCFPAVSHPMPFGLPAQTLLALTEAVWSDRLAGVCISEFDPGRDRDDRALSLLVWWLEWLFLKKYERPARSRPAAE
jgi:agmatinase